MDERGLTLIELLAVILIIGVPAALALLAFRGQAEKAYDADAMFKIDRSPSGTERICTAPGDGGCKSDSSW